MALSIVLFFAVSLLPFMFGTGWADRWLHDLARPDAASCPATREPYWGDVQACGEMPFVLAWFVLNAFILGGIWRSHPLIILACAIVSIMLGFIAGAAVGCLLMRVL